MWSTGNSCGSLEDTPSTTAPSTWCSSKALTEERPGTVCLSGCVPVCLFPSFSSSLCVYLPLIYLSLSFLAFCLLSVGLLLQNSLSPLSYFISLCLPFPVISLCITNFSLHSLSIYLLNVPRPDSFFPLSAVIIWRAALGMWCQSIVVLCRDMAILWLSTR